MQSTLTLANSETPVDAPCTVCKEALPENEAVYLVGHVRACDTHVVYQNAWDGLEQLSNLCGCALCGEAAYCDENERTLGVS